MEITANWDDFKCMLYVRACQAIKPRTYILACTLIDLQHVFNICLYNVKRI